MLHRDSGGIPEAERAMRWTSGSRVGDQVANDRQDISSCPEVNENAVSPTGRLGDFAADRGCLVKVTGNSRAGVRGRLLRLLAVCGQDAA
jgi:hypothetical protein